MRYLPPSSNSRSLYELARQELLVSLIVQKFDAALTRLEHLAGLYIKANYNPNETRIPAGQPGGGRWTDGGGAGTIQLRIEPLGLDVTTQPNHGANAEGVSAADKKNPRFHGMGDVQIKKQKFVDAHLAAAEKGAKQLNVPVENILGLSALESGWGIKRFPRLGKNFFGQHSPAPYEIGSFPIAKDPKVRGAIFKSYSDSLQSFIKTRAHLIQGVSDPAEFARALQNSGAYGIDKTYVNGRAIYTPLSDYVPNVSSTIKGLSDYIVRTRKR